MIGRLMLNSIVNYLMCNAFSDTCLGRQHDFTRALE
jgi:hypothetical protein